MLLLVTSVAHAEGLSLQKGTMQLGGTATFDIEVVMPDEGDNTTGFSLNLAPSFGYFIMDNLQLFGQLSFHMGFGDLFDDSKTFGLGVGAKYFLPLGSLVGYAGLGVGLDLHMPDGGDTMKYLPISVPLGILLPFNRHVALDLGTRLTYTLALDDGGASKFHVPIGYLGVQAFF